MELEAGEALGLSELEGQITISRPNEHLTLVHTLGGGGEGGGGGGGGEGRRRQRRQRRRRRRRQITISQPNEDLTLVHTLQTQHLMLSNRHNSEQI